MESVRHGMIGHLPGFPWQTLEESAEYLAVVCVPRYASQPGTSMKHRRTTERHASRQCPAGADGITLGHPRMAAKAEDKEQLLDAKRFASAARDFLLDVRGVAGPPARGEGLRSFPGGATPANCCQRRPQGDTATI